MRQIIFLLAIMFSVLNVTAQENYVDFVQIGDQLTLAEPSGSSYQHIDVPRKNFIIKRGGIANMATLVNSVVTVTEISNDTNPIVTFKRTNGKKFFRVYRTMTADLNGAIASGELKIPSSSKAESIVK